MKFKSKFITAFCCIIIPLLLQQSAIVAAEKGTEVAELLDYEGDIKIMKRGSEQWCIGCSMTGLREGDSVNLSLPGDSATIFFYNNKRAYFLLGECVVQIGQNSCLLKKGEKRSISNGFKIKEFSGVEPLECLTHKYAKTVRQKVWGEIKIIKPSFNISLTKPDVEWKEIPEAEEYEIFFRDNHDKIIVRGFSKNGALSFPPTAKPLSYGEEYICTVVGKIGAKEVAKGYSKFRVVDNKEMYMVKKAKEEVDIIIMESIHSPVLKILACDLPNNILADISPYLLLFSYYMQNELIDDACILCEKLLIMRSEDKNLHLWLAKIYELRGQDRKAKEEREKSKTCLKSRVIFLK
ncbi:MAG: hypothetical protein AB9903_09370 [Vulcanimicrobiota bacterium]